VLGELPDLAVRLEAARADHGLRRKLMEECRSKSIALLDRLRAGVQKATPTPITEPEPESEPEPEPEPEPLALRKP